MGDAGSSIVSHNMATDPDIESIVSASEGFRAPPTISHTASVEQLTSFLTKHTDAGVPCIITGFPDTQDDQQSPFIRSAEWLESFYRPQGELCSFRTNLRHQRSAHRTDPPVPPRVGSLVERIIYRPPLFDPARNQRFILRWNPEYFDEGVWGRDWCVNALVLVHH